MRVLSAMELLHAWEHAAGLPPSERALVLLEAAHDDLSDMDPSHYSLGARDARLMTLRESVFGREASAVVRCPACSYNMEVSFNIGDLRVPTAADLPDALVFADQGYEVRFRLPTSADFRALQTDGGEFAELRARLLTRCLLDAQREGEAVAATALPEAVTDAISERMAEADPQAQVVLKLGCDQCGNFWGEDFHIDSFFWAEIQAWAGRLLNEVHQLACAYGWSEAQILELSPLRRNLYLNFIAE